MTREECLLRIERGLERCFKDLRDPGVTADEEDFENGVMDDLRGCIEYHFMTYQEHNEKPIPR